MSADTSANFPLLVSRDRAGSAIRSALRLYIGRGRQFSVKQVSNATGVKDRVLECAMCEPDSTDFRPLPIEALLSISTFLGAPFTTEWLMLANQGAFDLPDGEDTPPGALAANCCDDTSAVVRAAVDGAFTDDERPTLRTVGVRMVGHGAALVSLSHRRRA